MEDDRYLSNAYLESRTNLQSLLWYSQIDYVSVWALTYQGMQTISLEMIEPEMKKRSEQYSVSLSSVRCTSVHNNLDSNDC